MTTEFLDLPLTLADKCPLTAEIWRLVLESPTALPAVEPGAHLALRTPSGAMRQYSIIAAAPHRYEIAVKREPHGRGGSRSLLDETRPGDTLEARAPENAFALVPAPRYLFIAGGIGITPILSMVRALRALDTPPPFHLVYCTRSPAATPFLDELAALPSGAFTLHHDYGDPAQACDLWPLLEAPDDGHVYCCGPASLMEAVRDMSGHWPMDAVHFEDFKPVEAVRPEDQPFTVRFLDDARPLTVAADRTLLQTLRDAGLSIGSSCESGTCGTCRLPWLEGRIEHRDLVLTPAERERQLISCVSRAVGDTLRLAIPGPGGARE